MRRECFINQNQLADGKDNGDCGRYVTTRENPITFNSNVFHILKSVMYVNVNIIIIM